MNVTRAMEFSRGMSNVTIEQASLIAKEILNSRLDGIDKSKGGRAWLSGEFLLSELEAICILVRQEAGQGAEGAEEFIRNMGQ